MQITITDLRARVKAIEGAHIGNIKQVSMAAMNDMLNYLEQQEGRRKRGTEMARKLVEFLDSVAPPEAAPMIEIMREYTKDE